jgi:hypothetical protein
MQRQPILMPAAWGGLVIGILSALPLVGAFNLCCCMWVITGGMLASYVLQSNTSAPITAGDGAVVGLLAGLLGAVVYAVVSLPLSLLLGPMQQRVLTRMVESIRDVPPELRDAFSNLGGTGVTAIGVILGFVMMLFVGAIFATVGGLLGAVFFKNKATQPPVQDAGGFQS